MLGTHPMKHKRFLIVFGSMIGISLIMLAMMLIPTSLQTNVLMISKIQKNQSLEDTIKNLKITDLVLPELTISERMVDLSSESQEVIQGLKKLPTRPRIFLSLGKSRETAKMLIAAERDPKKKQVLLWRIVQVLQKADGIAINFEGIFETFAFDEKLQLEKIMNDIRTLAWKQKKLIAGNGKNDLKFQNSKNTIVWYLNQERKNVMQQQSIVAKIQPKNEEAKPSETRQLPEVLVTPQPNREVFGGGASPGGPAPAPQPVPPPPSPPAPTPIFSFVPKKKFASYIENHGARRPQELINELLSESFTEIYVSNYEPEWTGEFIHLLKTTNGGVHVSVVAEGDCALALDATCGNKNLSIYKDPARVLVTTNIKPTNAWLLKYGSPGEKVEGIHYDVEAYLGPGSFYQCDHNGTFGKCTIDDVIQMVDLAMVPLQSQGYQQSMVWGSSRNASPDQGSSYSADLTRLFASAGFQKSVGQLVLLAYSDQFSNVDVQPSFLAAEKFCLTTSFCPQLIPVIETDHVPAEPAASFFEEGRQAAERMLVLTQTEEENLKSYAGQGVHNLLSYHEPALVNRAVFPGNIENEGDVKILSVSASASELSPAKNSITFTVNFNQATPSGSLSLQVRSLANDTILADASSQGVSGSNQSASLTIAYQNFSQEPEGSYEVNIFLTSKKYFDRTRKKANNVQTFSLKKTINPPQSPKLSIPVIFGFSQPSDITSPSALMEQQITDQVNKGVIDIPIYLGGNVASDGSGLVPSPNFSPFMNLLTKIETNLQFAPNTLRLRGYLRASVTKADADTQQGGAGKISLSNASVRSNVKALIRDIALNNKYQMASARLDLITLDFEAITASNYDQNDLASGDEGSVTQIAQFVSEIKTMNIGKKIGVYTAGMINKNWFPSETATPVPSPFLVSPTNYLSEEDAELLYTSGLDVIVIGAYVTFPNASTFVNNNPTAFGPIHTDFESFLKHQITTIRNIASRNPNLNLNPINNELLLIPDFASATLPNVVSTDSAVQSLKSLINSGFSTQIHAEAFDFGSLDSTEKALILSAQQ